MGNWLTPELALGTLLVTSFTCVGLMALWAATSPRHWLLRYAVVLAVLSPFAMISAYPPWLMFVLQACTVVTGVKVWGWFTARRKNDGESSGSVESPKRSITVRFTIRTLLAMACVVAMLAPVGAPLAEQMRSFGAWSALAVTGVCSGMAVLIGAWVCSSNRKWPAWLAASLLCLVLASLTTWFDSLFRSLIFFGDSSKLAWFVVIPILTINTWFLLRLWFAGAVVGSGEAGRSQHLGTWQIVARLFVCLLLILLALPPALVLWELGHPLPIPSIHVPDPNGIDDIVAAGQAFSTSPILSTAVEPQSTEQLAAEVAKYAADYERLRLGLARDIRAHIWARDGELDKPALFSGVSSTTRQAAREAARGLMREAELAEQQERYGDAARAALDNMQLGQAVTRDGLLIDYIYGVATEGIGGKSLYQVLPRLDADECRETLAALAEIERRRGSFDDALYRECACTENLHGSLGHFFELLEDIASGNRWERLRPSQDRKVAGTRLLMVELALRAFQLERGALPDRLEQLTPDFLAELPVDPFDPKGRPVRYRRTEDGHIVYSIGADGKDDGGRPSGADEEGRDLEGDGDLRLDNLFPPDEDAGDAQPNG